MIQGSRDAARHLAEFRELHGIDPDVPHHYIYGLHDPRTGELRYIGQSIRPLERLANHKQERSRTHRSNWIQSLRKDGLEPYMLLIDATPYGDDAWQGIERAYIAGARAGGIRLVNGTDGGDGVYGLSPESRARVIAGSLGRKASPETRALMSRNRKGRRHTPEHREYLSQIMRGREFTPEWRAKISAALNKLTDDQVREIRSLLTQKVSQYVIADRYGVHQGTINNIARGKTYRHVKDDQ